MTAEKPAEASLSDILRGRERRDAFARGLLCRYPGRPAVCFTVNIPGPDKRTEASRRVFLAGVSRLREAFLCAGIALLSAESFADAAGYEMHFVPDADAETVKRIACELEASLPYGRLLDIDVRAPGGGQVSRTSLGLPERGCMVCGAPGAGCASRRLHPLPEILTAFERLAATAKQE